MENADLDNIPIVEGKSFDAKKYKGLKAKIARVEKVSVTDWYTGPEDEQGRPTYNPNSKDSKFVIEIETEKLPELDINGKATSNVSDITVKRRFNLKKEVVAGQVQWVISKAPKAELWAFMRNYDVKKLSEFIGKEVILTVEADKKRDNTFWLRISD